MQQNAVIVTGAGRRIGHHIAMRLHQQDYNVVAHYRTESDWVKQLQRQGVKTMQADFSDTASLMQMIDDIHQHYASVRAIIHNASTFAPTDSDLIQAVAQYQQFFAVHMIAPFVLNQGLHHLLLASDAELADIIHITDIQVENPTPAFDVYGSTKAGLHHLMVSAAKKYAPDIKVNAVAPGPVLFAEMHDDVTRTEILAETPLAKEGGAESVFLAVESLLNNPFITGVSIAVDGGRRLSKA